MGAVSVTLILLLILLGVLGHTVWHPEAITAANFVVNLFTGAHVTA